MMNAGEIRTRIDVMRNYVYYLLNKDCKLYDTELLSASAQLHEWINEYYKCTA